MRSLVGRVFAGFVALSVVTVASPLKAADRQAGIENLFREKYEVRIGAFAHGIGGREKGSADINAELILPDFWPKEWFASKPILRALLPRPHVGAMGNFNSRTSYVYAGGLWTLPLPYNFFVEGFVGGSLHNGSKGGDATHVALGCTTLFHSGGSIGYRFNSQWNVTFTFDHLSNGNAVLHACPNNQGLNQYGVRIGYSF